MTADYINLKMFTSLHFINNDHLGEDFNSEVIASASLSFLRPTVASNFQHVLKIHNLPTRIIPDF